MQAVRHLALIGCGLMGGSFALALRQAMPGLHVSGFNRSPAAAERARALGIVDTVCASAAQAVQSADVVLLAVPVTATETTLRAVAPALAADALVMDVGSTKRDVVAAARAALGARVPCFVPAHPIAGKEHGGIEQAEATLYHDRTCILTPLPEHGAPTLARAQALWEAVGCRVVRMGAAEHAETYAAVSHLPHLLAFAYIHGIRRQEEAARHLALAGPGFRDFSRIACGTSGIWRDIFSANRDQVLAQLATFETALAEFRSRLESGDADALARLVDEASATRSGWRLNGMPLPTDDPA